MKKLGTGMKAHGKDAVGAGSEVSVLAGAGIGDTAVRKATGKGWGDWYAVLDAAGAREMNHRQILALVSRYQSGEWWQQQIAVAYEQARNLRDKHQKDDGFAATASKIINAGVTRVWAAWTDDAMRAGWLDASGWHVRKSVLYKSLKITWKDGRTHLDVYLWPRSESRTLVQVEHSKLGSLPDMERLKAFWGIALERLRRLTETAQSAAQAQPALTGVGA